MSIITFTSTVKPCYITAMAQLRKKMNLKNSKNKKIKNDIKNKLY